MGPGNQHTDPIWLGNRFELEMNWKGVEYEMFDRFSIVVFVRIIVKVEL